MALNARWVRRRAASRPRARPPAARTRLRSYPSRSPFNLTSPILLGDLHADQVEALARRHRLTCRASEIERRMSLAFGHSYLVRLLMRRAALDVIPLDDPVQTALRLAGMAAERDDGATVWVQVRNSIFASVFDHGWVQERIADLHVAELERATTPVASPDAARLPGRQASGAIGTSAKSCSEM